MPGWQHTMRLFPQLSSPWRGTRLPCWLSWLGKGWDLVSFPTPSGRLPCTTLTWPIGLLDYLPARVYSCEFGMTKPHPSIYRHALDKLDVAPAEAIFVGDKLKVDVVGPQRLGMHGVLVASPFRVESDPEIRARCTYSDD